MTPTYPPSLTDEEIDGLELDLENADNQGWSAARHMSIARSTLRALLAAAKETSRLREVESAVAKTCEQVVSLSKDNDGLRAELEAAKARHDPKSGPCPKCGFQIVKVESEPPPTIGD